MDTPIEIHKYYLLRNGKKVRVICVDAHGDEPVIGYEVPRPGEADYDWFEVLSWNANGRYDPLFEDPFDIIGDWVDSPDLIPHWPAVLSPPGLDYMISGCLYATEEEAKKRAPDPAIVRLAVEYPPVMLERKKST